MTRQLAIATATVTLLVMAALVHLTGRAFRHEHVRGEHYNRRCCICGGSIPKETP